MSMLPLFRIDRLKTLREEHGWSQRELGRQAEIGETLIRRYENGEGDPSTTALAHLAKALGVSTDYLVGLTDVPNGHYRDHHLTEDEAATLETLRNEGWLGIIKLGAARLSKPD